MSEAAFKSYASLLGPSIPDLGPGPRPEARQESELLDALSTIEKQHPVPAPRRELIRALVLLWHDHLDSAHQLAQAVETADGSYVHGIMHRREPDYGNAKYWFRRVGQHPCYTTVAEKVGAILSSGERPKFLGQGGWDAFGFVDACAAAERGTKEEQERMMKVQAAEFEVLLSYLVG